MSNNVKASILDMEKPVEPLRALQDRQSRVICHIHAQLTQLATLKTEQTSRESSAAATTQVVLSSGCSGSNVGLRV